MAFFATNVVQKQTGTERMIKMINCNTCRQSIPDDSEFCPFCGKKVMHNNGENLVQCEQLRLCQPGALLTRAFIFLEEESFDKADIYLEAVLNQEPENAQAYLGKLMVELRVKCKTDLINYDSPFDDSKNYQKIVRFADKMLVNELDEYIVAIKKETRCKRKKNVKRGFILRRLMITIHTTLYEFKML